MEDISIKEIFDEELNFEEKVSKIELKLNKKISGKDVVVFIDEIQESEKAVSVFKAFAESDQKYNIVTAGSSLGVKIKRFNFSFPVGKVDIKFMHPMDF